MTKVLVAKQRTEAEIVARCAQVAERKQATLDQKQDATLAKWETMTPEQLRAQAEQDIKDLWG